MPNAEIIAALERIAVGIESLSDGLLGITVMILAAAILRISISIGFGRRD